MKVALGCHQLNKIFRTVVLVCYSDWHYISKYYISHHLRCVGPFVLWIAVTEYISHKHCCFTLFEEIRFKDVKASFIKGWIILLNTCNGISFPWGFLNAESCFFPLIFPLMKVELEMRIFSPNNTYSKDILL